MREQQNTLSEGGLAFRDDTESKHRGSNLSYEPVDFLALLFGYAMSGERTLADFA